MNKNVLKIIACISMLIDHMGLMLFNNFWVFRAIGRIAFPIFAYFIGEGALKTSNKLKYFLRVFILGVLCQAVVMIEELIVYGGFIKNGTSFYFNILLSFSVALIVCFLFLNCEKYYKKDNAKFVLSVILFILSLVISLGISYLNSFLTEKTGYYVYLDYDYFAVLFPLAVVCFKNKPLRFIALTIITVLSILEHLEYGYYMFCTLIPIILLLFYNGEKGKLNLKYLFYIFYPAHLGLIYLLSTII